ncbi:MAG TPA: MFS transporter [Candidatus Sumerlaeota bacterium]|nr:MFS transporter [Candidatus Sumerlaeota bacterium]
MSSPAPDSSLSPTQFRQTWRVVTWAGMFGAAYYTLCVTGAPRVKFLTEIGASPFHFGLIATIGSLAILFQLFGGLLTNHVSRRKPVWMAVALTHRLIFAGVLAAPLLFDSTGGRILCVMIVLALHDGIAQLGAPMWLTWMSDLVPADAMNRHWGGRQRVTTLSIILTSILIVFAFDYFESSGRIILGFMLIGGLGIAVGVADVLLFLKVPEPPNEYDLSRRFHEILLQPLLDRRYRAFVLFSAYYWFSVMVAWPFFTLYMVDFLGVSSRMTQLILAAGPLGILLATRFWGLMCDNYGQRPVLQLTIIGKTLFPLAFILAPPNEAAAITILAMAMFLDGLIDGGVLLALQGIMLKHSPRLNRSMYVAATQFFSLGVAGGIAPLLAGWGIDAMQGRTVQAGPYLLGGFHLAFLISLLMRLGAFYLAAKLNEPLAMPLGKLLRHMLTFKLLRVSRLLWTLSEAEEADRRVEAARKLGELRSPLAIRDLIHALDDPAAAVREAAGDALTRIAAAETTGPLAEALINPTSPIRPQAARLLGRIGDLDSMKALLTSLEDVDPAVLGEVVDALGQIGDWSAILPLIMLYDRVEDPDLSHRIVDAMMRLSESESEEETLALLSNSRPSAVRT